MAIRVEQSPDQPFRDQPGRCSLCGGEVRPRDEEVFAIGCWDGRDADGRRAGGTVFGANCPACGATLKTYGRGRWDEGDPAAVLWYTDGRRLLVGGDRWRGRPGVWSPGDAPRHEARLRELRDRVGSLEEAVRVLHATAGLGAMHVAGLAARVAELPAEESKRLVVRALAPDWEE